MSGPTNRRFVRAAWSLLAFQFVAAAGALALAIWASTKVQDLIDQRDELQARVTQLEARPMPIPQDPDVAPVEMNVATPDDVPDSAPVAPPPVVTKAPSQPSRTAPVRDGGFGVTVHRPPPSPPPVVVETPAPRPDPPPVDRPPPRDPPVRNPPRVPPQNLRAAASASRSRSAPARPADSGAAAAAAGHLCAAPPAPADHQAKCVGSPGADPNADARHHYPPDAACHHPARADGAAPRSEPHPQAAADECRAPAGSSEIEPRLTGARQSASSGTDTGSVTWPRS